MIYINAGSGKIKEFQLEIQITHKKSGTLKFKSIQQRKVVCKRR